MRRPPSLRRQLLAWLLVPLVGLLAINAILSYRAAVGAANEAHDRLLLASVRAIADRVDIVDDQVRVDVPYVALSLFESRAQERIFYRVASGSSTITGYDDMPQPPPSTREEPVFFRAPYHDETVYFAAVRKPLFDMHAPEPVLIQVGETSEARDALSREILFDSLVRQTGLIVAAALVVWLGLTRGLRPIRRLRDHIAQRAPTDLSPIDETDVQSEVRPLIRALNVHTTRLEGLIAARRRFIDDASHQLRTPLAALKTQVDYGLGDSGVDRALLHDMRRTTDQTIRLVNQLLVLARADPQIAVRDEMADVDLVELARSTTAEFVPLSRDRKIALSFESEAERAMVRGSRLLLHELIVNLVDNAIRYTPAGGDVTSRVAARERVVALEVEDNGPGIAVDERDRVFERFYRGPTVTEEGSGLGLAIVHDICRAHGAKVELRQPLSGSGLRVVVTFTSSYFPAQKSAP